jgi:hypothetical protein
MGNFRNPIFKMSSMAYQGKKCYETQDIEKLSGIAVLDKIVSRFYPRKWVRNRMGLEPTAHSSPKSERHTTTLSNKTWCVYL